MALLLSALAVGATAGRVGAASVPRITDPRLSEVSGVAAARRPPLAWWAVNDSGHPAELFGIDGRGVVRTTVRVAGATNVDWEDLASTPAGWLFVGDIGDNAAGRPTVTVYRVREPRGTKAVEEVSADAVLGLQYPGGPRDAEALAVHPRTGDLFVVAKNDAAVFVLPGATALPSGSYVLKAAGSVRIPPEVHPFAGRVTAADISPDGRLAVLRTYASGYVLALPDDGDPTALWAATPQPFRLPFTLQGESLAFAADGRSLVSPGEGLPASLAPTRRPALSP